MQWLTEEFVPYLRQWEESVQKRKGCTPQEKGMMVLAKETRQGIYATGISLPSLCTHSNLSIISTVKSFVELVQYILKIPGAKYFLSERISQDPLENFFGVQRQRGRTGENPNVAQFCKNTQAIRLINSVCANVKGNCRGRKQCIDMEDNNPLPKRRRIRNRGDRENKDPSLHDNIVSSSPVQQAVSPPISTSAQQVISPMVSRPVHRLNSSPDSIPVQPVISPIVSRPVVSLLSTPQPVPQPDLTLKNSVISLTDQLVVSPPVSKDPISVQASSLMIESGKAEEIISKHHGIILRRQDLWTLNNHKWLNDQVSLT